MSGFGIYLHWPFCLAKCPYCDFNSHVSGEIDQNRWVRAYLNELDRFGQQTSDRILNSIYFGGGTPSLMSSDTVFRILEKIKQTWRMANDVEITLEANPTSVETGRFQGYHDAGVNRVSIGVQALNDLDLIKLGRMHSTIEARQAINIASHIFERVSFDLIYARQNQSAKDWQLELTQALLLEPNHLSLYQLTIEDGTAFGDRFKAGRLSGLPHEDAAADMYELTQDLCSQAGLNAYEISNHARPGDESRHNMIYWTAGDYVGIGPGAHGRLTLGGKRFATDTVLSPEKWLQNVEMTGTGELTRRQLTDQDQTNEYLMMGLRLDKGVSLDLIKSETSSEDLFQSIEYLEDLGMVSVSDRMLRATPKGRPVLNAVIRELLIEG